MVKKKFFTLCFLAGIHAAVFAQTATYKENYRPQYHFSPAINWTNDPNGLVYNNGDYHIFYQYNPFDNKWGHMTWGHATSKDLVHWKHLPAAIKEENGIMIFSGSSVVDKSNTSGLGKAGKGPMIAIYTGHTDTVQAQMLAYSNDNGLTWAKYAHNPILNLHKKDFRDPKVFWYAPKQYWVMAAVLPNDHKVQLYKSKNLLQWTLLSEFGPAGDVNGIWECPDLFQVPVANDPTAKKWVLTNSISTTMQYFVGEFDGVTFHSENADTILRPDYGPDFYAGITYNQLPAAQKPVMIAWANNWQYAGDIPTYPWKGAMTLPRELNLKKDGNTWLLLEKPVASFEKLKGLLVADESILVTDKKTFDTTGKQLAIDADFQPSGAVSGIKLAVGDGTYVEIGYDAYAKKLYMDRSHCQGHAVNKNYDKLSRFEVPLLAKDNHIQLHIYFDNSIIELFAFDGSVSMTMQVFPGENDNSVELFSSGGPATFDKIQIWKMKSAWE